jgi:hypothetical protein
MWKINPSRQGKFIYSINSKSSSKLANLFTLPHKKNTFLFEEVKVNKLQFILVGLLNLPLYYPCGPIINLYGVEDIDTIRMGLRSLFLSQAVVSGINISELINSSHSKIEKNSVDSELDPVELAKAEHTTTEREIMLAFTPTMINILVSQTILNSSHISKLVLSLSYGGVFLSCSLNLLVIYFINKKAGIYPYSTSMFKLNLLFSILNLIATFIIFTFVAKSQTNSIHRPNDEKRLEGLLTLPEFEIKEDSLVIEENDTLYELVENNPELLENIFSEEE